MFFKPASLAQVLTVGGLLLFFDAFLMNLFVFSVPVGVFQLTVGLPLVLLKREDRRQRLRNFTILMGIVIASFALVKVNAYVAPLHADRLIKAIEKYRAATGVYPKKLEDLVPNFIDHVPCAQYTLRGEFQYQRGGTAEPPMLWYNPHQMDHRLYHFETKDWGYLG